MLVCLSVDPPFWSRLKTEHYLMDALKILSWKKNREIALRGWHQAMTLQDELQPQIQLKAQLGLK